jgi:ABC-type Zn uptake system ZnuABC Zn-binding protein ZnuA
LEGLVQPGADAEAFAPRPGHLALVRGASLVVRVGLGYDGWLDRLLAQAGQDRLRPGGEGHLDLSQTVALLEVQGRGVEAGGGGHAHGAANPHYWLDPANAEPMSAAIAEALVRLVPERKDEIGGAQARFVADLRARLDAWTARLAPHRGAALVAYHNSWPYFARRFRLNIVEVIEPKEGVPPSPARLAALAAAMRERGVRAILHEATAPDAAARAREEFYRRALFELGARFGAPR